MKARISALIDSELDGGELKAPLVAAIEDDEARQAWRMYHLISDSMRGTRVLGHDFVERVGKKLEHEPAAAPGRFRTGPIPVSPAPYAQRYVYPAAASIAAVAFVGWLAFSPQDRAGPAPVAAPAAQAEADKPIIRIPPPKGAQDYLLAHQGFSPRNSLQGMAPYVRTVADEPSEQTKR